MQCRLAKETRIVTVQKSNRLKEKFINFILMIEKCYFFEVPEHEF